MEPGAWFAAARAACFGAALLLAAAAPAAADPVRIVAFGDSATAGYLVPRDQAYPAQLQAALRKKGYDVTVKNAGVNGGTLAGALKTIRPGDRPRHRPRPRRIRHQRFARRRHDGGGARAASELIRSLRARRIQVLVIGLGALDLSKIAKIHGVPYAQWKLPRGKYRARDGAHFNAQGYAILVASILPQIEALIARH